MVLGLILSTSSPANVHARSKVERGEVIARNQGRHLLGMAALVSDNSPFLQFTTTAVSTLYCCRYHDVASSRGYEALLLETLQGGTVDEEGRAALRRHRLANGIDSLHHVRVLKKMGWTLDDLEEGRKVDPPPDRRRSLHEIETSCATRGAALARDARKRERSDS